MNKLKEFDVSIIPIGSIHDYYLIYDALEYFARNDSSFADKLIIRNEYDIRTEESRKRFLRAININFLRFNNKNHENMIKKIFNKNLSSDVKNLILFWQFSLSNILFKEFTSEFYLKYYFAGRNNLHKEDLTALIKNIIENNPELKTKWSESTSKNLVSKYLTVLKKLGLAEGIQKKTIKHINMSNEALLIFICFVLTANPEKSNFLENSFLPFSLMSKDEFINRVKKLSLKDIIQMSFNGNELRIEPEIDRYIENVF